MITINSFKWLCTILFTIGTLSAFSQSTPCDPNNPVLPTITLRTPGTTICAGSSVTLITAVTNEGSYPTYVWKKNSQVIPGAISSIYTTTGAANGDSYTVEMTSSDACVSPSKVVSNAVVITVVPIVVADVTIQSDKNQICAGDLVTFTATPGNGGNAPLYEWFIDEVSQGVPSGISTFSSPNLKNNDKVSVKMYGTSGCGNPKDATSAPIEMVVNSNVTPSVMINNLLTVCNNTPMVYKATSKYGGTAPKFEWYIGTTKQMIGLSAGDSIFTYSSKTEDNGKFVTVRLTSDIACVSQRIDTSNTDTLKINGGIGAGLIGYAQTICYKGIPAKLTETVAPTSVNAATGTYKWEVSTDNTNWTIDPQTTRDYTPYYTDSLIANRFYRRTVTDTSLPGACNTATSLPIKITVLPALQAGTIGESETVCMNMPTQPIKNLISPTGGAGLGSYSYSWESSLDSGLTWSEVTGLNTNKETYYPGRLPQNYSYRRKETSGSCGYVYSNIITKTVVPSAELSVTINDPGEMCADEEAKFVATVENAVNPTYKWYVGGAIQGSSTSTLNYTPTGSENGKQVKVVVTSAASCAVGSPATSNIVALNVDSIVSPRVSLSLTQSVCAGKQTEVQLASISGGGANPSFAWYVNGVIQQVQQGNSLVYVFNDGDRVFVDMSSSESCSNPKKATSNMLAVKLDCKTAIDDEPIVQQAKAISTIYNLQGVEIDKHYKGLVIYKYNDGTTQKVIQE